MEPAIGIDLGTTNSVIAQLKAAGQLEVIPNAEGNPLTPSVVFLGCDPPLVGEHAKEMQAAGEVEIAAFFKRSMGDAQFRFSAGGRDWTPTDLSALVLGKLKADAEARLGQPIRRAVVTVPAYFADPQRKATLEAGCRAGLDVRRIINEPTAAALAYGLHKSGKTEVVLVYDLGGGTFDVTLVRIAPAEMVVLGTRGDHELGGKDWDDRIAVWLGERFADLHGVNPLDEPVAFNDLLVRTEKAKKELTARTTTRVAIHHDGKREVVDLTRVKFEDLTRDLMERTEKLAEQVLAEGQLSWSDLTGVLLVGGSTRMPMVHDYVQRMSGKKPMTGVNVDEVVALGAAVQAALDLEETAAAPRFGLTGRRAITDVTAHSLGVIAESSDRSRYVNSKIVPRNSPVPARSNREYEVPIGPDGTIECIAHVTEGESEDPSLVDVRSKWVCRGTAPGGGGMARIDVQIAYDRNGTIQVAAADRGGTALTVRQESVSDRAWLDRPPERVESSVDLAALKLVVSPKNYDDIGSILASMGLAFDQYDGGPPRGHILFLNCGSSYAPSAELLRGFVAGGGCVYASDLQDTLIATAFPGMFQFAAHSGFQGEKLAEVVDPELREGIGKDRITVTYDLVLASIVSVPKDTRVLLRDASNGQPLMAVGQHGKGRVFFTCFHNHAQSKDTDRALMRLLVMKQISAVSGLPIEVVSRATGLAVRG